MVSPRSGWINKINQESSIIKGQVDVEERIFHEVLMIDEKLPAKNDYWKKENLLLSEKRHNNNKNSFSRLYYI